MAKVDVEKLKKISHLYTQKELAEMFDSDTGTISRLIRKNNLSYVKKIFISEKPGYKICSKCKRELPFSEFNKRKKGVIPKTIQDIQSKCKECSREESSLKRKLKKIDIFSDRLDIVKKNKNLYCEKCRTYYPQKNFTFEASAYNNIYCVCNKCNHKTLIVF